MKSIYDKIKTPKELIEEVKLHGLNTETVNICRAQDIFGNAPISDLVELAHKEHDKFYFVLFSIWNWEDATKFYNEHSNPQYAKLMNAQGDLDIARGSLTIEMAKVADLEEMHKAEQRARLKAEETAALAAVEILELEKKVTELKAKLYDALIGDKETK